MLDMSDPLSAEGLVTYREKEYASAMNAYYSEQGKRLGQWHGQLVATFGLAGAPVTEEAVRRLAYGQHPVTGEELVRHRPEVKAPEWVTDDAKWQERIAGHYRKARAEGKDVAHGLDRIEAPANTGGKRPRIKRVAAPEYSEQQKRIIALNELAARLFREELDGANGAKAREYLEERRIMTETVQEFGLGLGLRNSWKLHDAALGHCKSQGLSEADSRRAMEESGLFYLTDGGQLRARFHGRLIVPIQDQKGNVIAFSGRTLDEDRKPKYMNSPETAVYKKSEVVFNSHRARQLAIEGDGRVVVTEGYFDAMAAHAAGVSAVAIGGTSFTEAHAQQLRSIGHTPVIGMDFDEGGLKAASRITGILLKAGVTPHVMTLGMDADDYIANKGAAAYRERVRQATDMLTGLADGNRWYATMANPDRKHARETDPGLGTLLEDVRMAQHEEAAAVEMTMSVLAQTDPKLRTRIDQELSRFLGSEPDKIKKPQMSHRAGFDAVFNAPKSVSLTGVVGDDVRVRRAHEMAAWRAATAMEEYAQARMGGWHRAENSGKWIAAVFCHDTARPVNGIVAPHLHTHVVVFNMSEDSTGKIRSLDAYQIYRAQRLAKAVYQSELAHHLRSLGYDIKRGKGNAPEIAGYTEEYLAAESPRHALLKERLERLGMYGRRAEVILQHEDREAKLDIPADELLRQARERGEPFGNQTRRMIDRSVKSRVQPVSPAEVWRISRGAVRLAKEKLALHEAVFDEFDLISKALDYGRGLARIEDIQRAVEYNIEQGRLIAVEHVRSDAPKRRLTTPELVATERVTLDRMFAGLALAAPMDVPEGDIARRFPFLNTDQRIAATYVLNSADQVIGIHGKAGTGKTTTLRAIETFARESGYRVHGLGPSGQAACGLADAGMVAETLQAFIQRGGRLPGKDDRPVLFLLDEASIASARQAREVITKLRPVDRLAIIGDIRQHQSIEAGRIFEELQDAGMPTVRLSEIIRQQDEGLRKIIEYLSEGHVVKAVEQLRLTGRITQIPHRLERMKQIAQDYAAAPEGKRIVSPDNESRVELNSLTRQALHERGLLGEDSATLNALIPRQDVTGPDRMFAGSYNVNDVVWYRIGKPDIGLAKGAYGTVIAIDGEANTVTVRFGEGAAARESTYNPKQCFGVALYRQEERKLAVGDRIQITASWRVRGIITRDVATITHIDAVGNVRARFDRTGRSIGWSVNQQRHIDYAYATTSFSGQGATTDQILAHIDTGDTRLRRLVNETFGYVGLSRGRVDVRVYVDNEEALGQSLSRVERNPMALAPEQVRSYRAQVAEKAATRAATLEPRRRLADREIKKINRCEMGMGS